VQFRVNDSRRADDKAKHGKEVPEPLVDERLPESDQHVEKEKKNAEEDQILHDDRLQRKSQAHVRSKALVDEVDDELSLVNLVYVVKLLNVLRLVEELVEVISLGLLLRGAEQRSRFKIMAQEDRSMLRLLTGINYAEEHVGVRSVERVNGANHFVVERIANGTLLFHREKHYDIVGTRILKDELLVLIWCKLDDSVGRPLLELADPV